MSDEKNKLKIAAQRAQRIVVEQANLKAEVPLAGQQPPEELEEEEQEAEEENGPSPDRLVLK